MEKKMKKKIKRKEKRTSHLAVSYLSQHGRRRRRTRLTRSQQIAVHPQ